MMAKEEAKGAAGGGLGFCGALALLFIGLKLTHYIDWSWWAVLAPLTIPIGIFLAIAIICGGVILICEVMDARGRKRARSRRL